MYKKAALSGFDPHTRPDPVYSDGPVNGDQADRLGSKYIVLAATLALPAARVRLFFKFLLGPPALAGHRQALQCRLEEIAGEGG